ncbi:hypothetical protein AAMO2058_001353900 [Amorphochlora amoebiformis]
MVTNDNRNSGSNDGKLGPARGSYSAPIDQLVSGRTVMECPAEKPEVELNHEWGESPPGWIHDNQNKSSTSLDTKAWADSDVAKAPDARNNDVIATQRKLSRRRGFCPGEPCPRDVPQDNETGRGGGDNKEGGKRRIPEMSNSNERVGSANLDAAAGTGLISGVRRQEAILDGNNVPNERRPVKKIKTNPLSNQPSELRIDTRNQLIDKRLSVPKKLSPRHLQPGKLSLSQSNIRNVFQVVSLQGSPEAARKFKSIKMVGLPAVRSRTSLRCHECPKDGKDAMARSQSFLNFRKKKRLGEKEKADRLRMRLLHIMIMSSVIGILGICICGYKVYEFSVAPRSYNVIMRSRNKLREMDICLNMFLVDFPNWLPVFAVAGFQFYSWRPLWCCNNDRYS